MRRSRMSDMTRGWFVGNFEPTAFSTTAAEVAFKSYVAGDSEPMHVHRVATEITCVVSGEIEMAGERMGPGDIAVLDPGEASDFRAVTAATLIAVKVPGASDDKFLA